MTFSPMIAAIAAVSSPADKGTNPQLDRRFLLHLVEVGLGSWLCKNASALNGDRMNVFCKSHLRTHSLPAFSNLHY